MNQNQVHIFATKSDLEALLRAIESQRELQFVRAGLFDEPAPDRMLSLLNSPKLGIAINGEQNLEKRYLVADRDTPIEIRTVPQHDGSTKYAIDQKLNSKTIVFWPGGTFGEMCVIAGNAGTASEDAASSAIFKLFSKEIRRQFKKIKSYYVGKEACELLRKGWRLTVGVKSPPLYDLKLN